VVTEITEVGDIWLPSQTMEVHMLHDPRSLESKHSTLWNFCESVEVYFSCPALKSIEEKLLDCDAEIVCLPTCTSEFILLYSLDDVCVSLLLGLLASFPLLSQYWNAITVGLLFALGDILCRYSHILSKFLCVADSLLFSTTPSSSICTEWKKSGLTLYTNNAIPGQLRDDPQDVM